MVCKQISVTVSPVLMTRLVKITPGHRDHWMFVGNNRRQSGILPFSMLHCKRKSRLNENVILPHPCVVPVCETQRQETQ